MLVCQLILFKNLWYLHIFAVITYIVCIARLLKSNQKRICSYCGRTTRMQNDLFNEPVCHRTECTSQAWSNNHKKYNDNAFQHNADNDDSFEY